MVATKTLRGCHLEEPITQITYYLDDQCLGQNLDQILAKILAKTLTKILAKILAKVLAKILAKVLALKSIPRDALWGCAGNGMDLHSCRYDPTAYLGRQDSIILKRGDVF